MGRKTIVRLKVGQFVIHDGKKRLITAKEIDGDVHVITLDNVITIRRSAGAKLEIAQ